jgi:hypothetical protein
MQGARGFGLCSAVKRRSALSFDVKSEVWAETRLDMRAERGTQAPQRKEKINEASAWDYGNVNYTGSTA